MGKGILRSLSRHKKIDRANKRTRSVSIGSSSADGRGVPQEYFDGPQVKADEIRDANVMSKYRTSGQITDSALDDVAKACVPGAGTFDLCQMGNKAILDKCAAIFKKTKDETTGAKLKRGIAYPCTVSINNVLCNHCPIDKSEQKILKEGDIVKVHCGTYVDGYCTQAARTIVVQNAEGNDSMVSQRDANALAAAVVAMNVMIKMMRPGTVNDTITDAIEHIGNHYGVQPCEGVLSNKSKRWIVDGQDAIICKRVVKELPQQDVPTVEIDEYQVWTLDVAFTTAESYKLNLTDENINIYRKNEIDDPTSNRIEMADYVLREVRNNLEHFPFTVNQCDKALSAKLGIKHINEQFDTFPGMKTRSGQVVARFCTTVAVTGKRIHILAGQPPMPAEGDFQCMKPIPESMKEILAFPLVLAKKGGGAQQQQKEGGEQFDDGEGDTLAPTNPEADGPGADQVVEEERPRKRQRR